VTVVEEILEWAHDRPTWQRDALRRLVLNGELSDDDIGALTDICKGTHGLTEQRDIDPLTKDHVPVTAAGSGPVSLLSIFHHRGVNALAEGQTLRFGPNLTVVYGDNAAGKTGYIRILKSACRARGQEQILGNVISSTAPLSPAVSIRFQVGAEPIPREWVGTGEDEYISRVSVFDTQCAAVYLTQKTDVAFRPFGLDLFDKLVQACRAVRAKLESEQRPLASNSALSAVQAQIPESTAAARLLANVSSLTNPETVQALARLSPEDEARLVLLEKSLADLRANNPEKLAQELNLRAGRVRALARHLREIEAALSASGVAGVIAARTEGRRKSEEARRLGEATFPAGTLTGTGSEAWAGLWEAARRFSRENAYPSQAFPVVKSGAHCVLCQQDFDEAAVHRMKQFESFAASTTEGELRQLRATFAQRTKIFIDLRTTSDASDDTLGEIRIEDEAFAHAIAAALATNEKRRKAIVLALTEDKDLAADCPDLVPIAETVDALAVQIESRVGTLRNSASDETRKHMAAEAQELNARKLLAKHEQTILDGIERRKKYAAYGLCIEETRTQAITHKSTAVTKTVVSEKLKQRFRDELAHLAFRHVEVELREAGGAEGVLYHKLVLTRAPGVELPRVVSEGEQRCLSIAAFFAELSTADDPSGIVFDDPVSSLDYKFREGVALRLVQESKTRQVILFHR
jgi:recombinational DNA repair ATPase RecF